MAATSISIIAQLGQAVSAAQAAMATAQAAVSASQARLTSLQTILARQTATLRIARTGIQRTLISRQIAITQNAIRQEQGRLTAAQRTLATTQAALTSAQGRLAAAVAVAPAPAPAPAAPTGLVRALCVGINYKRSPYELYGCINDANNIAGQLNTFFPGSGEIRVLSDDTTTKPTKANIMAALDWLVSGLTAGQNVLFHFSGHGGRVRDTNGDEVSGMDSCLYALGMGTIIDDELRTALAARVPAGCKCLVLLDCCHSGTAVDLRYRWQTPSTGQLTYTEAKAYPKTAGSVLFLSGCRDEEYAMDTVGKDDRPCGAMTMALLDTWRTYGAGIKLKYLLWDVRKYLKDNGYSQVPQLETGLFQDMNGIWNLGSAN